MKDHLPMLLILSFYRLHNCQLNLYLLLEKKKKIHNVIKRHTYHHKFSSHSVHNLHKWWQKHSSETEPNQLHVGGGQLAK